MEHFISISKFAMENTCKKIWELEEHKVKATIFEITNSREQNAYNLSIWSNVDNISRLLIDRTYNTLGQAKLFAQGFLEGFHRGYDF